MSCTETNHQPVLRFSIESLTHDESLFSLWTRGHSAGFETAFPFAYECLCQQQVALLQQAAVWREPAVLFAVNGEIPGQLFLWEFAAKLVPLPVHVPLEHVWKPMRVLNVSLMAVSKKIFLVWIYLFLSITVIGNCFGIRILHRNSARIVTISIYCTIGTNGISKMLKNHV